MQYVVNIKITTLKSEFFLDEFHLDHIRLRYSMYQLFFEIIGIEQFELSNCYMYYC